MTRPPVEVRPYDMRLPEGVPLAAFEQLATGPAMDFTGRPSDTMQRDYSRRLAELESWRPEQEEYSRERADLEVSRDAQDQFLQLLEQIMADQAQYSQMQAGKEMAGVPMNQMAALLAPVRQRLGMAPAPTIAPPPEAMPAAMPPVRRVTMPDGEPVLDEVEVDDGMSFKDAFRAARKADASIFHWRGKVYSTKVK